MSNAVLFVANVTRPAGGRGYLLAIEYPPAQFYKLTQPWNQENHVSDDGFSVAQSLDHDGAVEASD